MTVCLVGEQMLGPMAARGERIEQRHQPGVVAGLAGREQQGDRVHPGVDQGVNLGGRPAAGTTESMIVWLRDLVIRRCPLCGWRAPRRRVDGPARWSSRPTAASPACPPGRVIRAPAGRSAGRCHRSTSDDAASTASATGRTPPARPATDNPCETARRSLPAPDGDHATGVLDDPRPSAAPAPPAPQLIAAHTSSDHPAMIDQLPANLWETRPTRGPSPVPRDTVSVRPEPADQPALF